MNKLLLIAFLVGVAIPIVVNGHPLFKVFTQVTPVHRGRADTIISPGTFSQHSHRVYGASGFSLGVQGRSFQDEHLALLNSTCTTSSITIDKSAYWIPDLYYEWPNGTYSLVPNGGLTVYYFGRSGSGAQANPDYQAFPLGFRMIAGNPRRRSYSGTVPEQAMTFACLTVGPGPGETPYFPTADYQCKNGLRAQVFFPQCWDGVNLDSPDHSSHVAYPSMYNTGNCPASHPVRLPAVFYEVLFSVDQDKFPHGLGTQPFVWAMGDPTGYGLHGDFLNGWDVDILYNAMHHPSCDSTNTNNGNTPQNCLPLQPYVKTSNPDRSCLLDQPILNYEDLGINHWISHLPGNNPIQPGPADAVLLPGSYAQTIAPGVFRVLLKSVRNGLYVSSLRASGTDYLNANVPESQLYYSQIFDLIPLGGGIYGIQTESTSHWVSSNNGGSNPLTGDRRSPSGWEQWSFVYSGGTGPSESGTIGSILSLNTNKYVTVQANGLLYATGATITTNEQFWIIDANAGVPDTRP